METERKPFQCELSPEDIQLVEAVDGDGVHPEQQLKVRLSMFYNYYCSVYIPIYSVYT